MRYTRNLILVVALIGCKSESDQMADDQAVANTADSLIPIADEAVLPDDNPPAPPETVYVAQKTPPPVRRPVSKGSPPPAAVPAPAPTPPAPAPKVLDSGVEFASVTLDSVHSRYNKVGDLVRVRVTNDVSDEDGHMVIPAGSVVTLSISEIAPAPNRRDAGTLVLSARSVMVEGVSYPITARATDFEYQLKGRGIGTSEATKTGVGAVAGGIIGRVVGGKKGTVIGAIGGAAAGAAVADQQADRDIVVAPGTAMTITLRDDFERP